LGPSKKPVLLSKNSFSAPVTHPPHERRGWEAFNPPSDKRGKIRSGARGLYN
jgi:hypothetical protein